MPEKKIITGQNISDEMKEAAGRLRRRMTPAENLLWSHLRADKLGGFHFRRQQIIDRFIVDFYCHAASLVIEIDGGIHDQQKDNDQERDRHLNSRGVTVLHFTNEQVIKQTEEVLQNILKHCKNTA